MGGRAFLWVSRRRKEGVEKWSLDVEEGVWPPWLLRGRFLRGVAKGWRMERVVDEGVRASLRMSSVLDLRGVACMGTWSVALCALEGVPSSWRRSNNPSTWPSFCGVGPMTVFFEGVNRFRITDGES